MTQPTPWRVEIVHDEPVRDPHDYPDAFGQVSGALIYCVKAHVLDAHGRMVEGMGCWAHCQRHPIPPERAEEYEAVKAMRFAVDTINALAVGKP